MSPTGRFVRASTPPLPRAMVAVGGVLLALHLWGVVRAILTHGRPFEGPDHLVALLTALPFAALTLAVGGWLARSPLAHDRHPRIAAWWTVGIGAFAAIAAVLLAPDPPASAVGIVGTVVWTASIGSGVGATIGISEGRAIHRAVVAERRAVRSAELERQRDVLDYLNSVLRHEVLNTAMIIDGYATTLLEAGDLGDHARDHLRTIRRQADDMTRVIEDVRVLLHHPEADHAIEPIELAPMLEDEVRKLRDRHPEASIDVRVPDGVRVLADAMLPRAIANLLSNAVEHNDADAPRVGVDVTVADGAVRIRVTDDGPGLPPDAMGDLFDRAAGAGSSHGLGLYIVSRLARRYDGSIEVAETNPAGTTFLLTLPVAPDADERATDPVASAG
ncbi:MAG: sensor histidine kinase [Halobacteriales archaeon]